MPSVPAIAIIDDDEFVRDALQRLIESVGYVAMVFSSADEFVNSSRIRDVSCLIADVHMPGMTGFDLHDRLIRNEYGIPVILMTGLPTEKFKERARNSGAVDLLSKPISIERLIGCLEKALDGAVKQPQASMI
jgi:FixJ family two-component response regulator